MGEVLCCCAKPGRRRLEERLVSMACGGGDREGKDVIWRGGLAPREISTDVHLREALWAARALADPCLCCTIGVEDGIELAGVADA